MSTGQWDDPEYPYLPRVPAPTAVQPRTTSSRPFPWRTIARWLFRGVAATAALIVIALLVAGIALFQAASQAWSLADLEQSGAQITYWHQYPTNEDTLSQSWRDRLGDHWWSEPREISYTTDGYSSGLWGYRFWTEDDVKQFCSTCGRFGRLQKFTISTDHFSCEQIADWPNLTQLEELDVESSRLTDTDLAIIGKMTGLKRLRIAKAKVTTSGLAALAKLPNLEGLWLHQVDVRVSGGVPSEGFKALSNFGVGESPSFDDEVITSLGPLPAVEDVQFDQAPIGDEGLSHLLRSGKISYLSVGEKNTLTNQCLVELAQHEAPRSVILSGESITDSGLSALADKEFPTLVFRGASLTDDAFVELAKIKRLDELSILDAKVTGSGVEMWPADRRLQALDLSGNPLTDKGIGLLAKANCSELVLGRTEINDQQLMLFAGRDDLASLDVTETNVTPEGVKAFYEARKRRHKASGMAESLTLTCDFPEVAERYFNAWGSSSAVAEDDIPVLLP